MALGKTSLNKIQSTKKTDENNYFKIRNEYLKKRHHMIKVMKESVIQKKTFTIIHFEKRLNIHNI